MRRTTRRSARAARESPRPKMRGRDRERIGADRAGRRWKTRATRRSRARRLGKSHRYGTHRREVRVGENQQALGRLVVQERLHRDARGFVVHQRIGRFRLALERRHHARLEPVLQDVIGITLDLLRGLLVSHRGRLRARWPRAFDPLPLGDALRPPRTIPRRGAVPKLARRKRNATPRLASGDRGAGRVRGDSRGTSAFCPLRTRACKRSTAHHTRSQAFTGLDARVLCSCRAENHRRRPVWTGASRARRGFGARKNFPSQRVVGPADRRSSATGRPFRLSRVSVSVISSKEAAVKRFQTQRDTRDTE